jgi:opacity protein-like surface antigen
MRAKTIAFACGMGLIAAGAIDYQAMAGNPYIGEQAGAVFLQGSEFTARTTGGAASAGEINYDTGWGIEAKVTYLRNDVSGFSFSGAPAFTASDAHASYRAGMAGGYYGFDTGTRWTPYVGGGIGLALDHIEGLAGPGYGISDSQSEFAHQGMEYCYFATSDPTLMGRSDRSSPATMAVITSS